MKQLLAIFFATGFTYIVSLLAGKLVLQVLRVKLSRMEEHFVGFVTGAACLSSIVFCLTAVGQAHRGVFLAGGLIIIALAIRRGAHRFPSALPEKSVPKPWNIIFGLLYVTYGLLYLGNALLPETSPDGVAYHVALAARYLRAHHFPRITTNFTASYPEGMEMLFLFAFAFGKHTAAAMVHLLFLLVTPLGMLAYGRRIGLPVAGVVGALLFFLSPIVGKTGTSAYVDVALASALFAVFLLLEIWRKDHQSGLLVAIGLCAGFAYAIKYTGALAILYAAGSVVLCLWRAGKSFWRPAANVAAFSVLMAAPWVIKNLVVVRNPVSPFANRLFPNPYLSVWAERNWEQAQRHAGVNMLDWPLELTLGGDRLYGVLGPVFLLSPLLLLGLKQPRGRRLAVPALLFSIPCLAAPETRYWIPSLMFVSLGMALVLARWRQFTVAVVLFHALMSWPSILRQYVHPYAWRIDGLDWKAALRLTPERDFLRSHLYDYDVGLTIEKTVPPGEPVFSFSGIQQAYHSHEVIVEWTSSFGIRVSEILRTPLTRALQSTRRHDYRFPPIAAQKIRLVQTGASQSERWSITEFRVFRQGVELPRSPQWRLRASSNPWDVPLAFDNDAVTRWASGEAYQPGMYVEVDFGRPESIDQVTVACSRDQEHMHMRLEYEAREKDWRTVQEDAAVYDIPQAGWMRRSAIQEVERNHVHWLLVHDQERERGAADFFQYQKLWGIRLMATDGMYKLYRLE